MYILKFRIVVSTKTFTFLPTFQRRKEWHESRSTNAFEYWRLKTGSALFAAIDYTANVG